MNLLPVTFRGYKMLKESTNNLDYKNLVKIDEIKKIAFQTIDKSHIH